MATNDNTTGNFTVLVGNDGKLTGPFTTDGTLDFISKNNLATDAEVSAAKTEAISSAKTETEKQVSAVKTVLTDEINKKVNTSDYTSKVSSIESSIGSIETTINNLNNTYATDAEVTIKANTAESNAKSYTDTEVTEAKTELTGAISTAKSAAIEAAAGDATSKANKALKDAKSYTDVEVNEAKEAAIDEANQYTNTQIGNIVQFNISVVDKLPTTDIETNTIYLVPAADTEAENVNDEFLYINGEWEQIGTTAINLDDELKPIYTELDKLKNMMPEVIPNLNILPTITMTSTKVSNGSLYCVGEEVEFGTIKTNFNSGKIDPQGQSKSPYRCGVLTSVTYSGASGWGHTNETSLPTEIKQSYSFTNTILKYTVSDTSTTSWKVTASYAVGTQPVSNKGKNYGAPLPAGTKTATLSITGTYPFFATTSSIESTTEQSLVKLDTTSIKTPMVGCTDKNFWVLEVPACWTITNVTGAASGQLGGNATNAVKQWTRKNKVKTINDNNIKYYRYEYGADNAPKKGADTLTFSIKYDSNKSLSTSLDEGATWEEE